jgi:PAS domain S-box-containing protein
MFRFSLRLKFGLLLAGFALAILTIVTINFGSATQVATQLQQVEDQAFPRFSEAVYLADRFEEITHLVEKAVGEGEAVLLEQSQAENDLFLEHLEKLLAITPEEAQAELQQIRDLFKEYYPGTRALAEFLFQSEEYDEELFSSPNMEEVAARAQSIRVLRKGLETALQSLVEERQKDLDAFLWTAKEEVRIQSLRTLAIGLAAFLLILIFLVFLARRIVVPIHSLSLLTAQVARGNFAQQREIPLTSQDEVGDLVSSFQTMTQSLRESTVSKDYVDNIIKSMGDSLIVMDSDGTIEMVNQTTLTLLGHEENELLGKPIGVVLAEVSSSSGSGIEEVVKRGLFSNVEKTYLAKDGRQIPMSFTATPMHANGEIEAIVCVAQDITERKRAEEEAEDEGLEDFVPDLEKINSAGKHLLTLINDVLDLSKIEAGKMELLPENFEVAGLIAEVVSTVQPLVDKNGNNLEVETAANIGSMSTDLTKVRQSLFNLLSNAVKFTQQGQIRLQVRRPAGRGAELAGVRGEGHGDRHEPGAVGKGVRGFYTGGSVDHARVRGYGVGSSHHPAVLPDDGGRYPG